MSCLSLLASRAGTNAVDFGLHMRHRWYLYLPVAVIWSFAYARLFFDPMPRLPLLFNWTASLPSRVAVLQAKGAALNRGDHIVFAFDGDAQQMYPGLRGQPFFKVVRGLPGDRITVEGRVVLVNGVPMGFAKTHTFDRRPLEPIAPMVIPPDHFYVQGTDPDSFDSRYRVSGLVRSGQVLGRVAPIF
jgi:conjugal transfer pilin signal peptidase TrbI